MPERVESDPSEQIIESAYTSLSVEPPAEEHVLDEYRRYKERGGEEIAYWERRLPEDERTLTARVRVWRCIKDAGSLFKAIVTSI